MTRTINARRWDFQRTPEQPMMMMMTMLLMLLLLLTVAAPHCSTAVQNAIHCQFVSVHRLLHCRYFSEIYVIIEG